jgi:hypothetical protein
MLAMSLVQADEVPAVERQHRSAAGGAESDDLGVGDGAIGLASFVGSQHIVAKPT